MLAGMPTRISARNRPARLRAIPRNAPLGRKPNPRHSRTLCKRPPLLRRRLRRPRRQANAGGMVQAETDESAPALKSKQQMAAPAKPNLYAQKDAKAAPASGGIGAVARVVRTPDPKVLWQIAEKGVLKSEDGGATWRPGSICPWQTRRSFPSPLHRRKCAGSSAATR